MNPGAAVLSRNGAGVAADFNNGTGAPIVGDTETGNLYWYANGQPFQIFPATNVAALAAIANGTTDATSAILAAYAATPSGGTMVFPPGAYLISAKWTIDKPISVVFMGNRGVSAAQFPGSYLLKKSTMTTGALDITAAGAVVTGGGVVGQPGNTGDGIAVLSNNVTLDQVCAFNCGQDGIRIGSDASGGNANTFYLASNICSGNGRHGIYINSDNTGISTNANAGIIVRPFCQANGADGVKNDRGFGNTIIAPVVELNTGAGVRAASNSRYLTIVGGDLAEANTGGDLIRDAGEIGTIIFGGTYLSNNTQFQINAFVQHVNNSTGGVAFGLGVAASSESNASALKAGIALVRDNSNGRGSFYLCNNSTNDASNFTEADAGVAIHSDSLAYAIPDGITAPGTRAGWGRIFIDSADGDLKIKFGDGVVKTIVTDT